jgi:hypothetical protein
VITLTFTDIKNVVDFDLTYSYSKCGQIIMRQTGGCPIGGILSGIYAKIYCARDEYNFITKLKEKSLDNRIFAIRQMDDLLAFTAYSNDDKSTEKKAIQMLQSLSDKNGRSKVYTGGLEVEQQPMFESHEGKWKMNHFAGMKIFSNKMNTEIYCETLNKNEDSILRNEPQRYPRYPPASSYMNETTKLGVLIGNLARIQTQNTFVKGMIKAVGQNNLELQEMGYTKDFINRAVHRMSTKYKLWREFSTHLTIPMK